MFFCEFSSEQLASEQIGSLNLAMLYIYWKNFFVVQLKKSTFFMGIVLFFEMEISNYSWH